jgi:2-hydroxy-3-oxopropionate reductase
VAEVGVIGLGVMGAPMAANLVAAGHRVRGYSRTPATRQAAAERGVEPAGSAREAASGADVVITVLPDGPDVSAVLFGADGIAGELAPGSLFVDMSTIEPGVATEVHTTLAARGIDVLDAPVSGGEAGAIEATLSIMVGGRPEVFERARPVLDVLGTTVVHVGGPGSGQTVKAANQLVVAGHLQMLAEAVVLLRSQGVELEAALEVIGGGLAGSTVLQRKRAAVLSGDFTPGFRLALHHKDLGIVQRTARDAGVALPVTAAVAQLVQSLVAQGHGGLDHSALYRLIAELNGLEP